MNELGVTTPRRGTKARTRGGAGCPGDTGSARPALQPAATRGQARAGRLRHAGRGRGLAAHPARPAAGDPGPTHSQSAPAPAAQAGEPRQGSVRGPAPTRPGWRGRQHPVPSRDPAARTGSGCPSPESGPDVSPVPQITSSGDSSAAAARPGARQPRPPARSSQNELPPRPPRPSGAGKPLRPRRAVEWCSPGEGTGVGPTPTLLWGGSRDAGPPGARAREGCWSQLGILPPHPQRTPAFGSVSTGDPDFSVSPSSSG